jgi:putative hemolysin
MKKTTYIVIIVVLILLGVFYFYQISSQKDSAEKVANEVTNSSDSNTSNQLANPASVNCTEKGGTSTIMSKEDGSQYGLCYFDDNRACEEWAMMQGNCSVGGVKTTGFDTIDQKFCVWSGGQTLAVPNSVCTLKDGTKCSTVDFYNGDCPIYK